MKKNWQAFCLAGILVVCHVRFQEVRGDGGSQQFAAKVEKTESKLEGLEEKLQSLDQQMRSAIERYKEKMHKKFKEIRAAYSNILGKLTSYTSQDLVHSKSK